MAAPAPVDNTAALRVAAVHQHVTIFDVLRAFGRDEPEETHQLRCPFHPDHRPSARVYAEQNTIYCWTCQKRWDVIEAVGDYHGLPFLDAVAWLEREFAVPTHATHLQAALRATLQQAAQPDYRCAAELVETRLRERKAALGFRRYSKLLFALDLTVADATARRLRPPAFRSQLATILKASRV